MLEDQPVQTEPSRDVRPLRAAIIIGALGVVFGEGGIMALITLLRRDARTRGHRTGPRPSVPRQLGSLIVPGLDLGGRSISWSAPGTSRVGGGKSACSVLT